MKKLLFVVALGTAGILSANSSVETNMKKTQMKKNKNKLLTIKSNKNLNFYHNALIMVY